MSPERVSETNAVVFNDDGAYVDVISMFLEEKGARIAGKGYTKAGILSLLPALRGYPNLVVILDGNYKHGDYSGNDGREILAAIREILPQAVVIGNSGSGFIEGADENFSSCDPEGLADLVLSSQRQTVRS